MGYIVTSAKDRPECVKTARNYFLGTFLLTSALGAGAHVQLTKKYPAYRRMNASPKTIVGTILVFGFSWLEGELSLNRCIAALKHEKSKVYNEVVRTQREKEIETQKRALSRAAGRS